MRSTRYRMRGCSRRRRRTRRHRGGGNGLNLAYTGTGAKPPTISNPFLAYTGKGGGTCNTSAPSNASDFLAYTASQKGGCRGYQAPVGGVTASMLGSAEVVSSAPNLPTQQGGAPTGAVTAVMLAEGETISSAPNLATQQMGGTVDGYPKPGPDANMSISDSGSVYSGSAPYLVTGGMAPDITKAYPSTVGTPAHMGWINNQTLQGGGGCGCSGTTLTLGGGRGRRRRRHHGGRNYGDPVPNGLLGQSWTANVATWPGVDGVSMNRGHYDLNTYATDVSRQTQAIGANFPFNGLKGGRRHRKSKRHHRVKRKRHTKHQRGGTLSNYLSQDIINLGREFGFNVQSAYNTLNGQPAPVNPLPWKDQLVTTPHK